MKNLILSAIVMAFVFTACSSNTNETKKETATTNETQLYACSMHPEITGKKDDKCSKCGMKLTVPVKQSETPNEQTPATTETNEPTTTTKSNFSISEITSIYIKLKNALTKDDSKGAANAGKAIVIAMAKLDASSLTPAQKKAYNDVADDAKEHAEHIGSNGGNIEHQREHFAMLSKDMNDLIKAFGTSEKLYQDYCPMYNDGKGAIWISETKEIKNPYYGSKMIGCGSMKKSF